MAYTTRNKKREPTTLVRVYKSDAKDLAKKAVDTGGTVADHFSELKKLAEVGNDPQAKKLLNKLKKK